MHTSTDNNNITPDGDVTLIIGEEDAQFKVHSQVLKTASKVFGAMLSPQFSEGRSLVENGSAKITMPEDDAAAMEIILNVLHLQNNAPAVRDNPDPNMIVRIAVAADKYECKVAMEFAVKGWLRSLPCMTADAHQLFDLLKATYWFEDEECFRRTSLGLMVHYGGSYFDLLQPESPSFDQDILLGMIRGLEEQRAKIRQDFLTVALNTSNSTPSPPMGCCCRWFKNNYYHRVKTLNKSGVLEGIFTTSVTELLQVAKTLHEPNKQGTKSCPTYHDHQGSRNVKFNQLHTIRQRPSYRGLGLRDVCYGKVEEDID